MSPSDWIAVGALLVAGLTLYLAHRERMASHRSAVFQKQIDLVHEISPIIGVLVHEIPNLFIPILTKQDQEFVQRSFENVDEAYLQYCHYSFVLIATWPVALNDYLSEFREAADAAFMYAISEHNPYKRDDVRIEQLSDDLAQKALDFFHCTRNVFGTTGLIEKNMRIIGVHPSIRFQTMKREFQRLKDDEVE